MRTPPIATSKVVPMRRYHKPSGSGASWDSKESNTQHMICLKHLLRKLGVSCRVLTVVRERNTPSHQVCLQWHCQGAEFAWSIKEFGLGAVSCSVLGDNVNNYRCLGMPNASAWTQMAGETCRCLVSPRTVEPLCVSQDKTGSRGNKLTLRTATACEVLRRDAFMEMLP